MSTYTIDELDREEIEFLPARVVMTAWNPNPCCRPSCCETTIRICVQARVCCFVGVGATVSA